MSYLYYTVFMKTMRREWLGIDQHRLAKFLLLMRKFTRQALRHMQLAEW